MLDEKICPINKTHFKSIYALIKELAIFEKEPDAVTLTYEELEMYFEQKLWNGLVVLMDNNIAGIAIWYDRFSTWKGKILYLEDLIITEGYRGKGLGKKLLECVLDYGKENNYKGVTWQVLDWNKPAIDFYKRYNCTFDEKWINCTVNF